MVHPHFSPLKWTFWRYIPFSDPPMWKIRCTGALSVFAATFFVSSHRIESQTLHMYIISTVCRYLPWETTMGLRHIEVPMAMSWWKIPDPAGPWHKTAASTEAASQQKSYVCDSCWFMFVPSYISIFTNDILMTTGWWLGHPSEKYWKILVNWDDYSQYMGK